MDAKNEHRPAPLRSVEWLKGFDLDMGAYDHYAKDGKTLTMALQEHKDTKTELSPYLGLTIGEVIQEKKRLRAAGQPAPLTAFEECWKELGIQTHGAYTDVLGKVYEYSDSDVLFPEYWSNQIYVGLLKTSYVPEFVMGETVIDADNYHKIYLNTLEQNRELKRVGEYEEFPEVQILIAEESVKIQMFGAYVTLSYKAQKQQRLGLFNKALEQIGLQIDVDRMDDLVRTLRLGDGNTNTPGTTVTTAATGTIATFDVIALATGAPTPYKVNKCVWRKALLQEYLTTLADFDNPIATFGFMSVDLPRNFEWDRSSMVTDNAIAVDSRYAVEHITNGAVLVESEKIIRKQFTGTAVSHGDCFTIFDNNAVVLFDETH